MSDTPITARTAIGLLAHAATLASIHGLTDLTRDRIGECVTILTVAVEGDDPGALVQHVTVNEAAAILGVTPATVRATIRDGRLAYSREVNARRKYLDRAAVVAYRDNRRKHA